MKRPLVVITAGFVLGEVLALCLQEAVYRIFFLVCRSAVLTVACCQAVFKQECHVQDASAYFVFVLAG